ncbi:hypothetical protein ES703_55866 [subsurface metagenome]
MAGNKVYIVLSFAYQCRRPAGNVPVACTVKAVPADAVFFIKFVGQGIHIGNFRNSGMKSGIETGNLFCFWQLVLRCPDACKIRRIVQRSKVGELFNRGNYLLVDDYRAGKLFCSVHDPVTYGADLRNALYHTHIFADKHAQYQFHPFFMILDLCVNCVGFVVVTV